MEWPCRTKSTGWLPIDRESFYRRAQSSNQTSSVIFKRCRYQSAYTCSVPPFYQYLPPLLSSPTSPIHSECVPCFLSPFAPSTFPCTLLILMFRLLVISLTLGAHTSNLYHAFTSHVTFTYFSCGSILIAYPIIIQSPISVWCAYGMPLASAFIRLFDLRFRVVHGRYRLTCMTKTAKFPQNHSICSRNFTSCHSSP